MTNRLEARLFDCGITCRVEVRDRLALVVPFGELAVNADVRADIVNMARAEGFTHVAVEIDPERAPLSGD
jgi:hypothetical protein